MHQRCKSNVFIKDGNEKPANSSTRSNVRVSVSKIHAREVGKNKKNTIFHVRDISPLKEAIETVERNPDIM